MLLKSSDFISHDLSAESVFEGCADIDDDDEEEEEEEGRDGGGGGSGPKKAYYDYSYKLELVLRKWFAIDPSREMRAFVRDGVLIGTYVSSFLFLFSRCDVCYWVLLCGAAAFVVSHVTSHSLYDSVDRSSFSGISQRDRNYYEFLNEPATQRKIVSSFVAHWTAHVKPKWTGPPSCEFS